MTFIFTVAGMSLLAGVALATPRPLPFTYPPQTLPRGSLELEEIVDMVPVRVAREEATRTTAVTSVRSELQTEFEYGITDTLEYAQYFVFRQSASATTPFLRFQGLKERIRFPLAERGAWPIDVGLYFEVAEFHDEIEFEQKVLLARRFGQFEIGSNLWIEQEYKFQEDLWKFIYNPTLGATFEVSPHFTVGAEYWMHGSVDLNESDAEPLTTPAETADTSKDIHHYVGPTFMAQAGEYWASVGGYVRLDGIADEAAVGDPWGKVWIRAIFGLHL